MADTTASAAKGTTEPASTTQQTSTTTQTSTSGTATKADNSGGAGAAGAMQDGEQQSTATEGTPFLGAKTVEEKPAGEKPATEGEKEGKEAEPISFDDLVVPEGAKLDEAGFTEAKALFAGKKFSKEQAQAVLDLALKRQQAADQQVLQYYADRDAKQRAAVVADPEIGGAKLTETLQLAREGAMALGGEDLLKAFDEYRIGNDPRFLRAFRNAGLRIREDSTAGTHGKGGGGEPSLEQRLASLYDSPDMQRLRSK